MENKYILNENMDGNGPNSYLLEKAINRNKPIIFENKKDKPFYSKDHSKLGPIKGEVLKYSSYEKYACLLAVDFLIGDILKKCGGQK